MATTKLKIRNDLAKKGSGGPTKIFVQYCYEGKIKLFDTGKKIEPEFWDEKDQCVKRSYKGYTTINAVIRERQKEIDRIIDEANFKRILPTLEYVQEQYNALTGPQLPESNKDFFRLYEEFLKESEHKRSYNTIRQHRTTYNHLEAFQKKTGFKITLQKIDLDFYDKFTAYLVNELNQSPNTVANWIKNLKIFLGHLTEKGINTNLTFKSKRFKKPSAPTEVIALSQDDLLAIIAVDLSKNRRLEKVRDLFVFGCSTGLRFSDVANLKPENIKGDSIEITTIKTKDRLTIPLTPAAQRILEKYEKKLPRVMSNQKMNDYLKEIGIMAGLNEPVQKIKYVGTKRVDYTVPKYEQITTHTARRTFVTQSLERGMRPEIIMKITGHKDIKTMMKYVKITDNVIKLEMRRAWG